MLLEQPVSLELSNFKEDIKYLKRLASMFRFAQRGEKKITFSVNEVEIIQRNLTETVKSLEEYVKA